MAARIERALTGDVLQLPVVPSIALADDLPPSVAAEIPSGLLLGIALAAGSPTSHAAILARSLGIPAAVGLTELALVLGATDEPSSVAVDGFNGELLIEPTRTSWSRSSGGSRSTWTRAGGPPSYAVGAAPPGTATPSVCWPISADRARSSGRC